MLKRLAGIQTGRQSMHRMSAMAVSTVALAWLVLVWPFLCAGALAQDGGSLDGQWDGALSYVDGPGLSKINTPSILMRLIISGASARVYYFKDKAAKEVKPGAFRVQRYMSNAVVVAMDSGQDDDGTWVETWSFTVTWKDRDTLIVNWFRVVNNINLPPNADSSKFSVGAVGEMRRTR
jgi:hypothetical protein